MKPALRQAKEAMYRELVLEAAEQVFAEQGYESAKVQEIAAAAGIATATFYGVFKGKWAVYRAVHERRGQQLMEAAVSRLDLAAPVLEVLLSGIEAYVRFHVDHPDYLRMHLREGNAWAVAPTMRSEEQTAMWIEGVSFTAGVLQRAIDEGLFSPDDPEVMARTMIAAHQVRLAEWVDGGMSGDTEEMIRIMKQQVIRLFCTPSQIEPQLQQHGL